MKSVVFFALCCLLGLAACQSFEGTWNDGKRNFGGPLYICVDQERNVAHGQYSGAGLFTGLIRGNVMNGQWYEAGYDRPFGPFTLTLNSNGNSFTGTWSYFEPQGNTTARTFTWSGSRSSRLPPTRIQCLAPSRGNGATGVYEGASICNRLNSMDPNTEQSASYGLFSGFGAVEGYTYDFGRSVLLSNYFVRSDNSNDQFRPENNAATFGPCTGCNTVVPDTQIQTSRIVIGAAIDDDTFCGYFWEGLYNQRVSDDVICFERTSFQDPSDGSCAIGSIQTATGGGVAGNGNGNTALLLNEIQRVFDALAMPPVVVVQGNLIDDDDDGVDNNGNDDDSNDDDLNDDGGNNGGDDDDGVFVPDEDDDDGLPNPSDFNNDEDDDDDGPIFVPVPVPIPFPNPIPVPVPVPVPVPGSGSATFTFDLDDDDDSASDASALALSALVVMALALVF